MGCFDIRPCHNFLYLELTEYDVDDQYINIDRNDARVLAPLLQYYADHGVLPDEATANELVKEVDV
jgi:hypothetical protein